MVDTHVHLLNRQFNQDRGRVIERAFQVGNEFLVEVATDMATSERGVRLAQMFDGVYAAVGVHPHDALAVDDGVLQRLEQLADERGVVAIGETGLDFYRNLAPPDVQKRVFGDLIALARRKRLPLIVHIRDAYREALEIIDTQRGFEVGGVLHCFGGDTRSAEKAISLGFILGFGGTITYDGSTSSRLVSTLPLKHIVLETDSPYLGPEPYRRKRNEPARLNLVLDALSRLKRIPRDKAEALTSFNARELFRVGRASTRGGSLCLWSRDRLPARSDP